MILAAEPPHNCSLCPRLHDYLLQSRKAEPSWHNGPVRSFVPKAGRDAVRLLIVGLAPGLRGANRTGRPFTGDFAGNLLYATMCQYQFAKGIFEARIDDSLEMVDAAITNAVRCVPPENKPVGAEINTCRDNYLVPTLCSFPNLAAIITLGTIAHQSTIRAFGEPVRAHPFSHGGESNIGSIKIFSSYHCSRYNTNTGRLSDIMFEAIFARAREYLQSL